MKRFILFIVTLIITISCAAQRYYSYNNISIYNLNGVKEYYPHVYVESQVVNENSVTIITFRDTNNNQYTIYGTNVTIETITIEERNHNYIYYYSYPYYWANPYIRNYHYYSYPRYNHHPSPHRNNHNYRPNPPRNNPPSHHHNSGVRPSQGGYHNGGHSSHSHHSSGGSHHSGGRR